MTRFALLLVLATGAFGCASAKMEEERTDLAINVCRPDFATSAPDLAMARPDLAEPLVEDGGEIVGDDMLQEDGGLLPDDADVTPADLAMAKPADLAAPKGDLAQPPGDLAMGGNKDGGNPPPPAGKLRAGQVFVYGVTDDNWVVYYDVAAKNLQAMSLAGGMARVLTTLDASVAEVVVRKGLAFIWTKPNQTTGVGPLYVWSSTVGYKQVAALSMAGEASVSQDGRLAAFLWNANNAGTLFELRGMTSDLTVQRTLVLNVGYPQGQTRTCYPDFGFAGVYSLTTACTQGTNTANLIAVDLIKNSGRTVGSMLNPGWSADKAGTQVLATTLTGNLQVYPLAGGNPTVIDTKVGYGYLTQDGSTALYRSTANALRRSAVKPPLPGTLVGSGVGGLVGSSPDDKWVLFYAGVDPGSGLFDLSLASATMAGKPAVLSLQKTAALYGSPFTADAGFALYFSGVDPNTEIGDLYAQGVGGGNAVKVGAKAWTVRASSGAKIAFNDNSKIVSNVLRADLKLVDLAGGQPSLVAAQADPSFFLTATKDRLVYSLSAAPQTAGIYVAPIP